MRKLEETVERGGLEAALSRLDDKGVSLLADYVQRAQDAEGAGKPIPPLTPEEAEAAQRLEELREQAMREGWASPRRYRIV